MSNNDSFRRFPGFEPNPNLKLGEEFGRLARFAQLREGSKAWKKARSNLYVSQFASHYGGDSANLETWQNLCREVRVEGPIDSITKCKKRDHKALRKVHVNIVDLVDSRRAGTQVQVFSSHKALVAYTNEDYSRIFPKKAAKKDGFLKVLLRDIF